MSVSACLETVTTDSRNLYAGSLYVFLPTALFLVAFAKLRKATNSFMSARPPVLNDPVPTGRIFEVFSKIRTENSSFIKI